MLHFVTGRPGTGKSTLLLTHMESALRAGKTVLLLVPEQQTVLWESTLARTLPPSLQLHLEVTNFTRLANAVFRQYGGLAKPLIDDGGRTLVLWRAMLSVWDMLQVYNHGADGREDRNLPLLTGAIGELKRNRVSPLALEQAAGSLGEDSGAAGFAGRLSDISLLYAAYEEMLHAEYADRDDLLETLVQVLLSHPYFAEKVVFVDSFYSVTPPELRILRCAAAGAAELWVSFACDRDDKGELPFLRIRKFYDQMERIAAEVGQPVETIALTEDKRHTTPGLRTITAGLFSDTATPIEDPATATDVAVYQCADRYAEAEAVAAWIEEKVRCGCRYRDIAVVSRRMESLRGILDTTLHRHGIPCFLAEPDPLSASPAVRLFTSLLAVEARGFDRRDLLRMIATGLTPVSAAEGDCFAMYTETWNIRGRRMFCGDGEESFGWSWNPDGYQPEMSPWGKLCLRDANRARDKLLPPIAAFCDIFTPVTKDGKQTRVAPVSAICRGLVTFAQSIDLYHRLLTRSQEQLRDGRREESAKTAQVWDKLCLALDKMVSLLGDVSLDAGRFSGLLAKVISSMDIGAIPTAMDEVLLGSADGIRFGQVEHVLLVGAVEGEFPADVSDTGFFRDSDRILLEGVGIELAGNGEEYLAEEYWMFYRTAASATRSLTVFCPRKNGGELCVPSPGVAQMLTLLGRDQQPPEWDSRPLEKRIYHTAARTNDPALAAWLQTKADTPARPYYPGLLNAAYDHADEGCIGTIFGARMRLTQSRLDSFSGCPFRYWCQYGMALREAPHAAITSLDIGNFIHAILEQFFRETADREFPLPEAETNEIAERLIRGYLNRLGVEESGRLGYLFVRLRRSVSVFLEAIMAEYAQGRFVPMGFELPVGLPTSADTPYVRPVTIETEGGVKVTLTGIMDRVDHYTADDGREYVRVVDYKTGTRTFSLNEIRQGMHVQLLLYLFSLWHGGLRSPNNEKPTELLPAGAVYFQVRPGEVASAAMLTPEDARQLSIDHIGRSGIWLRDEEVLEAMDAGLSGKYVPVTRKKDGTLSGKATLQDLAQFGALYDELRQIIGTLASQIHTGHSTATPKRTTWGKECTYCVYGAVCRAWGK